MKKNTYVVITVVLSLTLFFCSAVIAADLSFQPRLEVGLMQYSFESGPISQAIPTEPVEANSGFNFTQKNFEYNDAMLVVSRYLSVG